MADPSDKFSREELAAHRAAAAKGEIPSLEIVRKFIASIRRSWLAKPVEKTQGKSRVIKTSPTEKDVDFF
jgi:hypothetical protein